MSLYVDDDDEWDFTSWPTWARTERLKLQFFTRLVLHTFVLAVCTTHMQHETVLMITFSILNFSTTKFKSCLTNNFQKFLLYRSQNTCLVKKDLRKTPPIHHIYFGLIIEENFTDLIFVLVLPSCILQIGVGVTRRTSIHRSRMHLAMPPCMLLGLTLALLDSKQHWAHVCLDFMMATTLPVVVSGRAFYHTIHIKNSFFHVFKPPVIIYR